MRFAVETWSPEYGAGVDVGELADSAAAVDVGVERGATAWEPIAPPPVAAGTIVFIDGVRRIDARVWLVDGDVSRAGFCATVGAGGVRCADSEARVIDAQVFRGLFAAATDDVGPIVTRHGTYAYVPCAGDTPEDLYLGIHDQMTFLETQVEVDDEVDLVVYDGPLRGRTDPRGVGFVKTQHVQYLPDAQHQVVGRLGDGERTPLFLIGGSGGFTRWSWYLRLPGPRSQPLSGVVRCELAGTGTVAEAIGRADLVSARLPRFASEPHKDARAPQNLYPIAGLEHDLRRRLGDPLILERGLRLAAAGLR